MKVLISEPTVKNPIRNSFNNKRTETGIRLSSLYLAGYVRDRYNGLEFKIQENRLRNDENIDFSVNDEIADSDIVAIGCVSSEFPDAYDIMRRAKEAGKITIMGGIFPTSNPELVLSTGVVDYVIRNEGEVTFLELLKALNEKGDPTKVKGISFIESFKGITHNPSMPLLANLDDVKPAYDLISLNEYAKYERGPIYTARGCLRKCSFCSIPRHWQNSYRESSIDNILEKIKLYADAGFDGVNFKDEAITNNRERAGKIFEKLSGNRVRNSNGDDLIYKIKSRIDGFDSELLGLMRKAGVEVIQVGIESTSDEKLRLMQKEIDFNQIRRQTNAILDSGIKLNVILILGYEGQTAGDLKRDMDFAYELGSKPNVVTYLTFNSPHPGSNLWLSAPRNGLQILSTDLNNYNHKRIVAIPTSLGDPVTAIGLLKNAYMTTRKEIGMECHNPELDLGYLFKENPDLKHKKSLIF